LSIIHDTLKKAANAKQMVKGNKDSLMWMGAQLKKLSYDPKRFVREEKLFFDTVNTVMPGRMYTFYYDPKHKETLPFYDRFPCIFVIEKYSDGFLGLNLHYLKYQERAVLLDTLYEYATKSKDDSRRKLAINYSIISKFSRSGLAKHCIKRYLKAHVKSRLMNIQIDYWPIVAMLPIQSFDGKDYRNMSQVWSRKK
jgi:hypothetical protein